MRRLLTLGLLLAASTAAWADPPQPVVPVTTAKVGETVQVTVHYKAPFFWDAGFDTQYCVAARMMDGQDGVATFWIQPKVAGEFHVMMATVGEKRMGRFVVKTSGVAPPVVDPVKPPVDPIKPPVDPLDPNAAPFPAGEKLWGVVIVEETAEASAARGKLMGYKPLFDYFQANGLKRSVVDQNIKDQGGQTPAMLAPYIAHAQKAGLPQLYVVGTKGTAIPMKVPGTPELLLETVKKYNR